MKRVGLGSFIVAILFGWFLWEHAFPKQKAYEQEDEMTKETLALLFSQGRSAQLTCRLYQKGEELARLEGREPSKDDDIAKNIFCNMSEVCVVLQPQSTVNAKAQKACEYGFNHPDWKIEELWSEGDLKLKAPQDGK